jgi:hypothetical protein
MNLRLKSLLLGAALIATAASAQDKAGTITRESVTAAAPIIRMQIRLG